MAQPTRILTALLAGLIAGLICLQWASSSASLSAMAVADLIGGLWLDALRMTIVPLIVSLLITGIAAGAQAARAGLLAFRSILLFVAVLWASSILAALLLPAFVTVWPLPPASGDALRAALGTPAAASQTIPGVDAFVRSIIPANPVAAAANDAMLPLVIFTTLFAFAVTRLPDSRQAILTGFFAAVADAMLVVIGWILWIGPLGVFALAFRVGAKAGVGAVGGLLHYIAAVSFVGIVICLLAYGMARFAGRIPLVRFARAIAPAQAVAISTQSSLASLPPMLASAERLGIAPRAAGVTLPLAVALFRATSPAMNVAVVLYIAHWLGVALSPWQVAAAVATAAVTTLGSVSLPGQVSFFTSIAPVAIVAGVPIEPLALLIAVETVPDIVRTVGNVSMDVAVTAVAAGRDSPGEIDTDAEGRLSP